ncbi:MAG: hypothetical protein GYA62_07110 [Bacteroidales bacterium]|nr:hypothetical protein [Bacteroidales bacterium]
MNTFILPGYSSSNKEWLEQCSTSISVDGFIRPVYWDHWKDEKEIFDAKEKANLIARHSKGDKVNIIAKSIGTIVASLVINQIPDQINKVIFCGIPLNDINSLEKKIILDSIAKIDKAKIICLQNNKDPHGDESQVKDFLSDSIEIKIKEADNHSYNYFKDFNDFLNS